MPPAAVQGDRSLRIWQTLFTCHSRSACYRPSRTQRTDYAPTHGERTIVQVMKGPPQSLRTIATCLPALMVVAGAITFLSLAAALPSAAATADTGTGGSIQIGLFRNSNDLHYIFPVTPAYAIQYYAWQEGFRTGEAEAAWNTGTETFAELQTCDNPCDSTGVPVTSVINGKYDAYLTTYAEAVKAFGHPVMLTFDHEMNGAWYPWGDTEITPSQWIAAWQHVTTVISSIAANVTWVWAPNVEQDAASVESYWPGNGYPNPHVNVIGLDGYLRNGASTWANTFSQSVRDVESASSGGYSFIIAETGVAATSPNNLSQIDGLIAGARSVDAQAVMYFDAGAAWSFSTAGQSEFIHATTGQNAPLTGPPAEIPETSMGIGLPAVAGSIFAAALVLVARRRSRPAVRFRTAASAIDIRRP